MSRMSIDIPAKEYAAIKALAASRDETLREFVLKALRARINGKNVRSPAKSGKEKTPNKKLLATFRKTDQGKDLFHYKNAQELFKELGM